MNRQVVYICNEYECFNLALYEGKENKFDIYNIYSILVTYMY